MYDGPSSDNARPTFDPWSFKEDRLHEIAEIRGKLRRLTAEMVMRGYHYLDVFSARWAIGEALLNAIQHGHHLDATKTVRLGVLVANDYVLAEVTDEGPGFNPDDVPNPFAANPENLTSKKGLAMMRLFMSWVRFEGRGNRVTLCKIRTLSKQFTERVSFRG
jgi:serine/threonine-protein kinase RsbW